MTKFLLAPEPVTRSTVADPRARILYVDDEPALRRLGELALVHSGYAVDTAADGAEAWAALLDVNYHLLITDHAMPRLTGLELAAKARLAGMRLPIVLVSGSVEALSEPASAWLGLAARLKKPLRVNTLLETVEQALRAANSGRSCADATSAALVRLAGIQPYLHGGINE